MAPLLSPSDDIMDMMASVQHPYTNGVTPSTHQNGIQAPLDASKLQIKRTTTFHEVPQPNAPETGETSVGTDHMMTVRWTFKGGWQAPQIVPYGPLSIMPTASCLHYATQCFEGMKVYRGYDGKLRLFRPDCNCKRMVQSSARVALPSFDPKELEKLIMVLMSIDGPRWLPQDRKGHYLYLRPAMIADAPQIGVQIPKEVLLFVIAVPWPDLPAQIQTEGLRLIASRADTTRAWPGGFGNAKVGANYGPSFVALGEARDQGYNQVLWLFGNDCHVTEAGASNFFVVWKNKHTGRLELVTAPLKEKIILEGVTRRSVLDLARSRLNKSCREADIEPVDVIERNYTMMEIEEGVREGSLVEAFVSGTAYFITPVSHIHFRGRDIQIPMSEGSTGQYARLFKTWLKEIMYGVVEHEWGVVINE